MKKVNVRLNHPQGLFICEETSKRVVGGQDTLVDKTPSVTSALTRGRLILVSEELEDDMIEEVPVVIKEVDSEDATKAVKKATEKVVKKETKKRD